MNVISKLLSHLQKQGVVKTIEASIDRVRKTSKQQLLLRTSCDIGQSLPATTKLPHPTGIVIAGDAEIGENVMLFQNVTIGRRLSSGTQKYPIIGDNVTIYAGATVIGGVTIGSDSVIGSNSVVLDDIPPQSVAVGAPAKVVQRADY